MRKLAVLAVIALIGGAWYVVRDPGHVPLFDASLQRLAETEAEAHCAGVTFWTNRGQANPAEAEDCRTTSDQSTEFDLTVVQPAFCRAVTDQGYEGGVDNCLNILEGQKLWPTYDGGLTGAWSDTAPYPGDRALVVPPSDSRTGSRDGFSRDDEPEATTTTTAETSTTEGED